MKPSTLLARIGRIAPVLVAIGLLTAGPLAVGAANDFTDVTESNVFKADIKWMADAAVTKGCNPPANTEFCPSDNVTREQMAAFMHRLAANKVVDAATAQKSDDTHRLAGRNPSAYQTVVAANENNGETIEMGSGELTVNRVEINVPADGVLVVQGSAYLRNDEGSKGAFGLLPRINGNSEPLRWGNITLIDGLSGAGVAYTTVFEVEAGTHVVTQSSAAVNEDLTVLEADHAALLGRLVVTWHPEGTVSPTS